MVKAWPPAWKENGAYGQIFPEIYQEVLNRYGFPATDSTYWRLDEIHSELQSLSEERLEGKMTAELWGRIKRLKKEAVDIHEQNRAGDDLSYLMSKKLEEDEAMRTLDKDKASDEEGEAMETLVKDEASDKEDEATETLDEEEASEEGG